MNKTSFAIGTILKHEHDYINQFIEHHLNLGFDFFYIIIDNLDYEQINYESVIKTDYKKYIKLYNLDKNFDYEYYNNIKKQNLNPHQYWINYFNQIVLPDIKENWILMIGGDSFLYLNDLKIETYVNNVLNKYDNIFQFAFPWLAGYNLDDLEILDFCGDVNKLYFQNHNHTYGMALVSNIEKLHLSSHLFVPKNEEQIIYIPNDIIFKTDKNVTPYDIFIKNPFDINNLSKHNIFALHVQLRNYDEIIIKDYFSWNLNHNNDNLKKLILEDTYNDHISKTCAWRLHYILNNCCKKINKLDMNIKNNCLNTNIYTKNKVMEIMNLINVSQEQYDKFLNNLYVIGKKTT
jgi:hypothetical protein